MAREITRFFWVGLAGFAVDAGLLYVLTLAGGAPFLMRLFSFAAAVLVTWIGHRHWTFDRRDMTVRPPSFVGYLSVQLVGVATNYATFILVLMVIEPTPANAVLAAALGSGVAMTLNYFGASRLVFRSGRSAD